MQQHIFNTSNAAIAQAEVKMREINIQLLLSGKANDIKLLQIKLIYCDISFNSYNLRKDQNVT
jgi:hypothetical protein